MIMASEAQLRWYTALARSGMLPSCEWFSQHSIPSTSSGLMLRVYFIVVDGKVMSCPISVVGDVAARPLQQCCAKPRKRTGSASRAVGRRLDKPSEPSRLPSWLKTASRSVLRKLKNLLRVVRL